MLLLPDTNLGTALEIADRLRGAVAALALAHRFAELLDTLTKEDLSFRPEAQSAAAEKPASVPATESRVPHSPRSGGWGSTPLDQAVVTFFAAPNSYTGEDLVEFHLPGSPVLARMLLDELLRAGARAADPGEFTARAYFNGRMDLTAAEGVAATIAATGERELTAARQLLAGELARHLAPVMDLLADTLALAGGPGSEQCLRYLRNWRSGAGGGGEMPPVVREQLRLARDRRDAFTARGIDDAIEAYLQLPEARRLAAGPPSTAGDVEGA